MVMAWWPAVPLILIVGAIFAAERHPRAGWLFRWLPTPLWCYVLPLVATTVGWLPPAHAAYRSLTNHLLPVALALLLLGTELPAILRTGVRALIAAAAGALAIGVGAPLGVVMLHAHLPVEAWKGAGALAGTWTGGTMNLLALRTVLDIPDAVFAPLIIVDALVAYGWMALLITASALQQPINRWLGAHEESSRPDVEAPSHASGVSRWRSVTVSLFIALTLTGACRGFANHLPTSALVSTSSGWTILLVTAAALGLAGVPPIRRVGSMGHRLGSPCLLVVLAATGAQGSLAALWSSPAWVLVGACTVIVHGAVLATVGRLFRIPLGVLATASQANIGGVVSAPMVGAVYRQSLAPVGLLLAIAGNAMGTYVGLLSALLCKKLI